MEMPIPLHRVGDQLHGLSVSRVVPLPDISSVAYELTHAATGALLLHIHSADAENLFAVALSTPPVSDSGLPHIMEHSVLGGSKKYPVRDPFFSMVKGSMATFINAMTYPVHTVYPVASNVRKDLLNLAGVYWDAVFHPLLTQRVFRREGWRLEPSDDGGAYQGIVYNEMKGAYSDPRSLLWRELSAALFPTTPPGRDSGGSPPAIRQLSYAEFLQFHRDHYRPGNALIFAYGDISTADYAAFVGERLAALPQSGRSVRTVPLESPLAVSPSVVETTYPDDMAKEGEDRTYACLGWLLGGGDDPAKAMSLFVLERLLLGHQGAPLRKAIIDSHIGEDLVMSGLMWGESPQSAFLLGIQGTRRERASEFASLVTTTLKRVADEGFTADQVAAALQQASYDLLEVTGQYPLNLLSRTISAWVAGCDPVIFLESRRHLADFSRRLAQDPKLLSNLIRSELLENPHQVRVTLVPDAGMQARSDAEEREAAKTMLGQHGEEGRAALAKESSDIARELAEPEPETALECLPKLAIRDLPTKPHEPRVSIEALPSGGRLLTADVFGNGVSYLQAALDVTHLDDEQRRLLPFWCGCFAKLGAAGQDYATVSQRIARYTGGVSLFPRAMGHVSPSQSPRLILRLGLKCLDPEVEPAMALLDDLLRRTTFTEISRIGDLLTQAVSHQRNGVVSMAMQLAAEEAAGDLSELSRLSASLSGRSGIVNVHALRSVATESLAERLDSLAKVIRASGPWTISVCGAPSLRDAATSRLGTWGATKAAPQARRAVGEAKSPVGRRAWVAPMDVSYCAMSIPSPTIASENAGLLMVASRQLGLGYLLEEIRLKGSAYGAGASYSPMEGTWGFTSYRDPHLARTLGVFGSIPDQLRKVRWTQAEVDRAIIGVAKEADRPERPGSTTASVLTRHLQGETPEWRARLYASVLSTTPATAQKAALDAVEAGMPKAAFVAVTSRERAEQANGEIAGGALKIENLLPE